MQNQIQPKPLTDDDYVDLLKDLRSIVSEINERVEASNPDEIHRDLPYSVESLGDWLDKEIRYFSDFENYDLG